MPFREKFTWVSLVVTVAAAAGYSLFLLSQPAGRAAGEIPYQMPMVAAIGVTIVTTIVGTIVFGIGGGIAATTSNRAKPGDIGRVDDRDREIALEGGAAGAAVASGGALVALVLAMARADQFWIANAIFGAYVAASVVSAVVRLVAYRRGF
jgi:hypothetical protein